MSRTHIQNTLTLLAPAAVKSGDMVMQTEFVANWADDKDVAFIGDGDAISIAIAYFFQLISTAGSIAASRYAKASIGDPMRSAQIGLPCRTFAI